MNSKIKNNITVIIFIAIWLLIYKSNEDAFHWIIHGRKTDQFRRDAKRIAHQSKNAFVNSYNNNNSNDLDINNYQFNKCTYTNIPKVSGILETAEYLRYSNKSIISFCDGDIRLMLNISEFKQPYFEELGRMLRVSFSTNDDNTIMAIPNIFTGYPGLSSSSIRYWMFKTQTIKKYILNNFNKTKQYFDCHITSPYISTYNTSCEIIHLVYYNLRMIWLDKDVVIVKENTKEKLKYDIFNNTMNKTIISIPDTNPWTKCNDIMKRLMDEDKNKLYILTAGPITKVIANELIKQERRVLDLGEIAKDYDFYMKDKEINNSLL